MSTEIRPCAQCGFDPEAYAESEIPGAIVGLAADWRDAITLGIKNNPDALLIRPDPGTWAPLEYACHVRDVLAVFTGRVEGMVERGLTEMRWWDPEAAPEANAYLQQDPAIVADTINSAGCGLATVASRAEGEDWDRTVTRRSGEVFTLLGLLKYCLHEVHHHLHDFSAA